MLLLLPLAANCIWAAPERCLQSVVHRISLGLAYTDHLPHYLWHNRKKLEAINTAFSHMSDPALTHPNLYLKWGLLTSKKTQQNPLNFIKTKPSFASHYFTSSAPWLLEVAIPPARPQLDLHWRKRFCKIQLFWRYSKHPTERYHSYLCICPKRLLSVYILVGPTVASLMVLWLQYIPLKSVLTTYSGHGVRA